MSSWVRSGVKVRGEGLVWKYLVEVIGVSHPGLGQGWCSVLKVRG